ncbi:MAG: TonB-dependent receptor, partial [Sphingomonas bacterium]|nr:TonB-dependent receptor [Sphingomonas bacterium]
VNNRVASELAPPPVGGTLKIRLIDVQPLLSAADLAALQQVDLNEAAINAARLANGGTPAQQAPLFGPAGPGGTGLDARLPGIVQVGVGRRITETGSRNALDERNAFRLLAGVKGPAFGDFNYEAYYSYARTRNAQIQRGNISRSAFRTAVENSTINVFGPNTLSQADVDGISILAQNGEISVLQVASASLSGTIGNLGMGGENIGLAVGAEYRKMAAEFIPDTALSSGDVVGFNAGDPTKGDYNVKEIFGEVRIPIIADRPFFHRLDLNGAARYSDYSLEAVGKTFTYAAGAEWAPIRDITFRAQYQRAVRAPNVGELFGGQSNGFPAVTDPCSSRSSVASRTPALRALCEATGVPASAVFTAIQPASQIEGIFGGNPNLEEETSDTFTAGVVLRPSFIPRLNVSIDYFNIKVDNFISTLGGGLGGTLNLCYNVLQSASSVYCQVITAGREPGTGILGGGDEKPLILNANVAKNITSGVDLAVDYNMPLNFGLMAPTSRLSFFFLGTYTKENSFYAVQELDEFTNCAGKFGTSICGQPQPKFKWSTRASLTDGPLTTSLRWRHLGKAKDDNEAVEYVVDKLKAYDLFDLTFGFEVNENLNFALGVNNIFDKKPPILGDNAEQANTYPGVYDVLGRDFFISAGLKF